ncbi:serine/threonine protein kinase RCK2 PWA37_004197 [Arxiozyma heterogenica]|uniref:non-specific serine/threonine protein kinase n=1 Tax=Arxiozyma heterogenica TaxID=278026 RepID=A0AAN7WN12_9SACH|nr:hypothetical protein RI543_003212 [Kazachstania heterogenica]
MNKLKSIFHINKKTVNQSNSSNNSHGKSIKQSIISNSNREGVISKDANDMGAPTRRKLEQLSLTDDSNTADIILEDKYNEMFRENNDNSNDNDNDKLLTRKVPTECTFNSNMSLSSIDSASSVTSSASASSVSSSLSSFSNEGSYIQLGQDNSIDSPVFTEQKELIGYKLIAKIGEGAFSKVFKGINLSTGEKVAIKVIRKETLSMVNEETTNITTTNNNNKVKDRAKRKSQTKLEQVLKEVTLHKMVTSLQCENIVRFIEFKETSSFYYIVQELLTGGEIFNSIVKYTYFSEDLSRHVIKQLGNAIKALHSIGVVHRDIKPENLLFEPIEYIPRDQPRLRRSDDPLTKLDEGVFRPNIGGGGIGIVKLTDFGLSKQIYQTNTKTPCGTVGYTAPEVVRDERYSMKVDMWGIGCVLYTMLCGFPPFYDDKIDLLTEKISRGEYTFLQPWWDEISDGAKNCVARLLEVDPDRRYNIDQFLNDPWLNRYDTEINVANATNISGKGRGKRNKSKVHEKFKKVRAFQEDPSILYSPAAVAMRDAFDISNAVKRNDIGTNRNNNQNNKRKGLYSLDEELEIRDEDEFTENNNRTNMNYISNNNDDNSSNNNAFRHANVFELNLNTSTIIQRRQKKQRMVMSNNKDNYMNGDVSERMQG